MNASLSPQGYTVIEVMIFLAISTLMLVSAVITVGGQQAKIQYAQAMRDVESKIQDVMSDISTGYYPQASFECIVNNFAPNDKPMLNPGSNTQGTNEPCTFIGKVLQFSPGGSADGLNIFTVIGRRQTPQGTRLRQVSSLEEANPVALATAPADLTEEDSLRFGLQVPVDGMKYGSPGSYTPIGAMGFFSSFGQYNTAGNNLLSSAQKLNLAWVPGTSLGDSKSTVAAAIENITDASGSSTLNPESIVICFEDANSDQRGFITIGGSGRQLTTELILDGECPS